MEKCKAKIKWNILNEANKSCWAIFPAMWRDERERERETKCLCDRLSGNNQLSFEKIFKENNVINFIKLHNYFR